MYHTELASRPLLAFWVCMFLCCPHCSHSWWFPASRPLLAFWVCVFLCCPHRSHSWWFPARNLAYEVEACWRLMCIDLVRKRIMILELKMKDIACEWLAMKSRLYIHFLQFSLIQIDLLCWNFLILSNENKWEKITSNNQNIHINSGKRKLIAFETILFDKFTKPFYLI